MNELIVEQSEAYKNFINSINSEMTRKEYAKNIRYFMTFCNKLSYEDLISIPINELEGLIRDFIVDLRHNGKLSPSTVSSYLSPISHFYEMNDITISGRN